MRRSLVDDTIVAISTPIGESGIGIVRISGPEALKIADEIFVSKNDEKPSSFKTHTVHYGQIVNSTGDGRRATSDEVVDEVLITIMRAPKTYTREDIVEINCHGGMEPLKEVLELIVKHGARVAEPGEFTKRAFLSGRIDLVQAEAVLDMIKSKTDKSLKAAVNNLEGVLSEEINGIRDSILDILASVEASIDFSEEDIDVDRKKITGSVVSIITRLKRLVDSYKDGIVLREGVLAVICGKPNAGKSSLMNLLLKRDRVIVTPIPGTTRDAVEEMINLNGIPIRLVDTAGIGRIEDVPGMEGIRRSKSYLDMADLVLLVFDGSNPMDKDDMDVIKLADGKKVLVIINKVDLPVRIDRKALEAFSGQRQCEISVEKRTNIGALENSIVDMIWAGGVDRGEGAIVMNARHKDLLDKALARMSEAEDEISPELITINLKDAVFDLGLIVGKSVSDDVLDRIFERFCIGK